MISLISDLWWVLALGIVCAPQGKKRSGIPRHELDFYPTPPGATWALLEVEKFCSPIWEPACGDGALSKVLEEDGYEVISSDLVDRGYGTPGIDFLSTATKPAGCDTLITNPPFKLADQFVEHAIFDLDIGRLALLCKLTFLESQARTAMLARTPLSDIWIFRNRVTMFPGDYEFTEKHSGTTMAFAWYIWTRGYPCFAEGGRFRGGWITEVKKKRLRLWT